MVEYVLNRRLAPSRLIRVCEKILWSIFVKANWAVPYASFVS